MDNATFANLLAATPPTDLRILGLATELAGPDGGIDIDAGAARQQEIEAACREAEDYAASTARLAEALRWKTLPRRR